MDIKWKWIWTIEKYYSLDQGFILGGGGGGRKEGRKEKGGKHTIPPAF